jgi:hypothetical protein
VLANNLLFECGIILKDEVYTYPLIRNNTSKDIGSVKCALCDKRINAIEEIIDSETYAFDGTDCALIFKKYRSVYGNSFED